MIKKILFLALLAPMAANASKITAAVRDGDIKRLQELVERGENINELCDNKSALDIAIEKAQENPRKYGPVITYLEDKKGYDSEKIIRRQNQLIGAARSGDIDRLKDILNEGIDINALNNEGKTALDVARENHETEIEKFLMKKKAVSGDDILAPKPKVADSCSSVHRPSLTDAVTAQRETIRPVLTAVIPPIKRAISTDSGETTSESSSNDSSPTNSTKIDKTTQSRARYPVNVEGENRKFLRFLSPGDGDCGLHSLSVGNQQINRRDFVARLQRALERNDAISGELISDIRNDVYDYCLIRRQRPNICGEQLDTKGNISNQKAVINYYITNVLPNRSEFLSFGHTASDGTRGTLAAAARIYGLNVRQWVNRNGALFLDSTMINNANSRSYVNVLFNGENHYDVLVDENDRAQRNRATENERR